MYANVLHELFYHEPFRPFSVHLNEGTVHEVRHPDWGMIQDEQLIIKNSDRRSLFVKGNEGGEQACCDTSMAPQHEFYEATPIDALNSGEAHCTN